jgi:hypothetical protein
VPFEKVDELKKRLIENQERRRKLPNYFDDEQTGIRHIPRAKGQKIDPQTAAKIFKECNNNPACATEMALDRGYSL